MLFQFIIHFSFSGFLYKAEVKAFNFDDTAVYDIYYSLTDQLYPVEIMQIYRGSGPDQSKIYWRQRITGSATVIKNPDLIEAIGRAIALQEDLEKG